MALLVPSQTWCVLIPFIYFIFILLPHPCHPSIHSTHTYPFLLLPRFFFNPWRDHVLTARFQPPFIFYHTICHTQRYAHQEEYFALDDAEFRNVTSILKLLALGAHKVCRTLHVSSFAYDAPFFSPCFFFFLSFGTTWAGGGGLSDLRSQHTPQTCFRAHARDLPSPILPGRPPPWIWIWTNKPMPSYPLEFRFLFRALPYPGAALPVRRSVHPSIRSPFPL